MYLAVPGLSCGMQDLRCGMQDCSCSLVAAGGMWDLFSVVACQLLIAAGGI